jgi:hypothetical protein
LPRRSLGGTKDAISLDDATKKQAWKEHIACLSKAKSEGKKSAVLKEYVQKAPEFAATAADATLKLWKAFKKVEPGLTKQRLRKRRKIASALFGLALSNPERAKKIACESDSSDEMENISLTLMNADDTPQIIESANFVNKGLTQQRPVIIEGVLKKKAKLLLSGASKSRKTWILLSLAYAVTYGKKWLGFKCNKGKVLYVNFELFEDTFEERQIKVADDMKVSTDGLDLLLLRGYAAPIEVIVERIIRKAESGAYDLVIVDPVYKALGDLDENKSGDIAKLMNELEDVSEMTGAAVAICHHFSKGDKSKSQSGDRGSGSGVFARDPDAIIEVTPEDPDDPETKLDVSFKLREFPAIAPFVIKRYGHVMIRDDGAKVTTGKNAGKGPLWELGNLLDLLTEEGLRHKDWKTAADEIGIGKKSFDALLKDIRDGMLAEPDEKTKVYTLTPAGEKALSDWKKRSVSRAIKLSKEDLEKVRIFPPLGEYREAYNTFSQIVGADGIEVTEDNVSGIAAQVNVPEEKVWKFWERFQAKSSKGKAN